VNPRQLSQRAVRTGLGFMAAALALGLSSASARAFPPYRSTDAEVAPAGVVEARVGLLRAEREDGDTRYTSPLLRVNLGVGRSIELISELEYDPEAGRLGDGALGAKWARPAGPVSVGVETLALLPVSSRHSGVGAESQFLLTLRRAPFALHANAGGFVDARPRETEAGWRASLLAELERGRVRLGAEVFAKQVHGEGVRIQAGPGAIVDVGPLEVRGAIHVGLTSEAPDLAASLWLSWKRRAW
jgi:hypothetical protein